MANISSGLGEVTKNDEAMAIHLENGQDLESTKEDLSVTADQLFVESYPEKSKKKLLAKLDMRIVPIFMCLYVMSFIDRANIGNAQAEGMSADLGMTGAQYNVVLSIFFVTYIIFDIPSNYLLEKYFQEHPSWYVAGITLLWGIMMTMHGLVHNYGSIMAVRLLMGMFEAGFVPGAFMYMTKWHSKFELATRYSTFYVGSALAGAFSGLLAYAFNQMDGVGGLEGWRWIFLMEGIIIILLALIIPIILLDTPNQSGKWLNDEERRYLIARMTIQNGGKEIEKASGHFSWKLIWDVITDWQIYIMAFNYWSNNIPSYGLKFTMPQIMKNMGFSGNTAQLMTVPPYIAGAISAFVFGRLSDKFKRRSFFVIGPQLLVIIGYSILTPLAPNIKSNIGPCYFAIVLANIGLYPISPGSSSWLANNVEGPAKRAIAFAYMASLANLGGIASSYIFIASEAPAYPTGFGTSLAFASMGVIASILLDYIYIRINKQRDQVSVTEVHEKYTVEELAALGDRSPLFRYTL
ncbi:hypothetical protein N7540_006262 [Penicillium herquei]|nr:hypothetical protein N7540_006262 [Penicillium herquei]